MRQNRPIPHWIRMRTDNTIRTEEITEKLFLKEQFAEAEDCIETVERGVAEEDDEDLAEADEAESDLDLA
uniref:Ribosomal protein L39e n=1 Tax=Salix viminalis TaxID=40686 RepID=A0A6N2N897_SALVM